VPKLRRAGADRVISPQHIGAEWIANVLTRPNVVDFVDMASKGGELEMAEIAVPVESPLAGKSLRQADIRKLSDVIIVAIRRADGTRRFNPSADEIINPGDVLITVGEAGAALKLSTLRSGHFGAE
jgi:voltage-gated potassium channel